MSNRYLGGVISATAPTTSNPVASGVWTLAQQLQAKATGNWPGPMNITVNYLVVAGGGAGGMGGSHGAAAGGGGGF